jgi:hypothetical protein
MDVHTLRVHQASAMLWRKGSKPSSARLNNKVCRVPFKVLPVVAGSFPPPLLVSEETGSPPDDVQLNHRGVPHLYPPKIFGCRISKWRLVFLSFLMSQGKFSIIFLSTYTTKNLVRMLLLLSHFSPFYLGPPVGWALQLSKIPSNFITSDNALRYFSSSALFRRQRSHDLCFC